MRVKEAIDRLEREKERNFETRNSNKERIRFEIIPYIYTFIEIEKFNRIERWKRRRKTMTHHGYMNREKRHGW